MVTAMADKPLGAERLLQWFQHECDDDVVDKRYCELAHAIVAGAPPSAERTVAMRKLLESLDAYARAVINEDVSASYDARLMPEVQPEVRSPVSLVELRADRGAFMPRLSALPPSPAELLKAAEHVAEQRCPMCRGPMELVPTGEERGDDYFLVVPDNDGPTFQISTHSYRIRCRSRCQGQA